MSALSLMALDRHRYLKVKPGDVVVLSSKFIPGNERAITHIINEFSRRGARVMYEKVSDVHVSGHASEEELRYLIRLVHPKCFIPIHGEYRHLLRHAHIAIEEGIPADRVLVAQDGDLVEISHDGARVIEQDSKWDTSLCTGKELEILATMFRATGGRFRKSALLLWFW